MNKQSENRLTQISYAQKQRLAFIDFCLFFKGFFSRQDITKRFEMGIANASRDIALYKELAKDNLIYTEQKHYIQSKHFKPVFNHDARKTLIKLANEISDGFDAIGDTQFPVTSPAQLNVPNIYIVARLVQAILNNKVVNVIYTSLSSGSTTRELIPHSIVDNGLRWHVRAFDRRSKSFRDFVLTRISKVTLVEAVPAPEEDKLEDHQWQKIMTMQLVAHPHNVKYPRAIEMDYGMVNGMLEVKTRAALAGYLLRRWNVDCTVNANLLGGEYQLLLRNRETLNGADNLSIAPGYKDGH